jgi:phosphoglycolate phosphatase-like HAD superfamily hydrolase
MSAEHYRIGFDFDDVLVSSGLLTVELHNKQYGTHLTIDDWYDPDVSPWGVDTFSEVVQRVIEIQASPDFSTVEELVGAKQTLMALKAAGHALLVVTGRPPLLKESTEALLAHHYGEVFSLNDVHFTDHFAHEGQRTDKGDIAVQLKLTHFVDDVIQHANSVAAKGVKTILFSDNYKWNQAVVDDPVSRISSWDEIATYFDVGAESQKEDA